MNRTTRSDEESKDSTQEASQSPVPGWFEWEGAMLEPFTFSPDQANGPIQAIVPSCSEKTKTQEAHPVDPKVGPVEPTPSETLRMPVEQNKAVIQELGFAVDPDAKNRVFLPSGWTIQDTVKDVLIIKDRTNTKRATFNIVRRTLSVS